MLWIIKNQTPPRQKSENSNSSPKTFLPRHFEKWLPPDRTLWKILISLQIWGERTLRGVIKYIKFHKNFNESIQRYGQKTSKLPPQWVLSPICDPPREFLYPFFAQTSCKESEKTSEQSPRCTKTDRRTDRQNNRQGGLHRTNQEFKIRKN